MSTGLVATILVFSIPILAILMGGVKQYFEFRERQNSLGSSARALEGAVGELQQRLAAVESERDALQRRVQNLETIVTNEAWDALHDLPGATSPAGPPAGGSLPTGDAGEAPRGDAPPPAEPGSDPASKTEDIARRIQSR